ncbi:unnamed protein product [Rhodiola kirilowii]
MSHHSDNNDEDVVNNDMDQGDGVPLFYENPEDRFREMRRRHAAERNHGQPEDQARNGPRQPVRPHPRPHAQPHSPRAQYENFDNVFYQEPTFEELSAPNFRNQSWCIYESPELEDILVSTGVVHNLPKFAGTQGESATSHIKRFHAVCQNLKLHGVEVEDFKLKAFYFSLMETATD